MNSTTEGFATTAETNSATATVQSDGGESVTPLSPTDTALSALSRLVESDHGRLPVLKDGELVGTVSDADLRQSNRGELQ